MRRNLEKVPLCPVGRDWHNHKTRNLLWTESDESIEGQLVLMICGKREFSSCLVKQQQSLFGNFSCVCSRVQVLLLQKTAR